MANRNDSRRLVTEEEKARINEVLKTNSDPIEVERIKNSLPYNCFVSGNRSAIAWKVLDKYLVSIEEISFAKSLAKKWKGMLSETPDEEERGVLLKYLSASQYGCFLTENIYSVIGKETKLSIDLKADETASSMIRKVSDRYGIPESKIETALKQAAKRKMPSTLLANATRNLNNKISASKSKKVMAKNVTCFADPKKHEFKTYNGTKMRPDFVICYKDGSEMAHLCFEHFGWKGSSNYVSKMTKKLTYCVENGIPFFYSAPKQNDVFIEEVDAELAGTLEASVYNWNKANFFVADNSADAIYLAIDRMLNYIGMQKFNMPIEELFKA